MSRDTEKFRFSRKKADFLEEKVQPYCIKEFLDFYLKTILFGNKKKIRNMGNQIKSR